MTNIFPVTNTDKTSLRLIGRLWGAAGPTPPGEQRDQRHRGSTDGFTEITPESHQDVPGMHQDAPGLTKTHPASPQITHELTEPLKT